MKRLVGVIAGALLVGSVWAQSASAPLNLKLPASGAMPPGDLPAPATTAARPKATAPGVYYGDTSGRTSHDEDVAAAPCDDSRYDKAQVHGSVGMGVVGGNHMSGSYQTGTVDITKNLGDCDHPTGAVRFSIGVGNGNFHTRGW